MNNMLTVLLCLAVVVLGTLFSTVFGGGGSSGLNRRDW